MCIYMTYISECFISGSGLETCHVCKMGIIRQEEDAECPRELQATPGSSFEFFPGSKDHVLITLKNLLTNQYSDQKHYFSYALPCSGCYTQLKL